MHGGSDQPDPMKTDDPLSTLLFRDSWKKGFQSKQWFTLNQQLSQTLLSVLRNLR